jgi:hypothetical protein
MLIGGGVSQDVRRRQLRQQIQPQFHHPKITSLSPHARPLFARGDSDMPLILSRAGPDANRDF